MDSARVVGKKISEPQSIYVDVVVRLVGKFVVNNCLNW